MAAHQTMYQRHVPPVLTGINASLLSSSPSCIISTEGFSYMEIEIDTAYASASNFALLIDTTQDVSGTPTWRAVQEIRASATAGTYTSADFKFTKTLGAADNWVWRLEGICCNAVRLKFSNPAGDAAAGDTLTVGVKLGVM